MGNILAMNALNSYMKKHVLARYRITFHSPHSKGVEVRAFLLLILAHSVEAAFQGMAELHDTRIVGQNL